MIDPDVDAEVIKRATLVLEKNPNWTPTRCYQRAYIELVIEGVLKDESEDGKDRRSEASFAALK